MAPTLAWTLEVTVTCVPCPPWVTVTCASSHPLKIKTCAQTHASDPGRHLTPAVGDRLVLVRAQETIRAWRVLQLEDARGPLPQLLTQSSLRKTRRKLH